MSMLFAFAPLCVIFIVMYFLLIRPNRLNRKLQDQVSQLSPEQKRKRSVMMDAVLIPFGILLFLASDRITKFLLEGGSISFEEAKTLNNLFYFGGLLLAAFCAAKLIWFLLDTKDSGK